MDRNEIYSELSDIESDVSEAKGYHLIEDWKQMFSTLIRCNKKMKKMIKSLSKTKPFTKGSSNSR